MDKTLGSTANCNVFLGLLVEGEGNGRSQGCWWESGLHLCAGKSWTHGQGLLTPPTPSTSVQVAAGTPYTGYPLQLQRACLRRPAKVSNLQRHYNFHHLQVRKLRLK